MRQSDIEADWRTVLTADESAALARWRSVPAVLEQFARDAEKADDGEFSEHAVNCARSIARRLGITINV